MVKLLLIGTFSFFKRTIITTRAESKKELRPLAAAARIGLSFYARNFDDMIGDRWI